MVAWTAGDTAEHGGIAHPAVQFTCCRAFREMGRMKHVTFLKEKA